MAPTQPPRKYARDHNTGLRGVAQSVVEGGLTM